MTLIAFPGNCTTGVVRMAKYRIQHFDRKLAVTVMMRTDDGDQIYPATHHHPKLVKLVNGVKEDAGLQPGGIFIINEWRQVIVPVSTDPEDVPVQYHYAGEYHDDIVLKMEGSQFCGRPFDSAGLPLKPGSAWNGPRPGLKYKLKAGAGDIEWSRMITPQRERIVKLSHVVGRATAQATARRIAGVLGHTKGGAMYVNEFGAIFGPSGRDDGYSYLYLGQIPEPDHWFKKPIIQLPPASSETPSQPAVAKREKAPGSAGLVAPESSRTDPKRNPFETEDSGLI
jgi:hypothetical protein